MTELRRASERGHFRNEWLDSHHSFSFADYHDPAHMGFSLLRVINDDRIAPAGGFGTHPHREMEIITYQLAGSLEHKDSTGGGDTIRPGDVQRMSAGTGISHSEFNPSHSEQSHLLQIWLKPTQAAVEPGYTQKNFDDYDKRGKWCLLVSTDGREASLTANTDVALYATLLDQGNTLDYQLANDRVAYLQVARGDVTANGHRLSSGDALKFDAGCKLQLDQATDAEILLFDLPAPAH